MKIKLPESFYALSKYEQEEYLKKHLAKHHKITDRIMKLLGKMRGEHRKLTEKDLLHEAKD
jgi:hypothetical protein